MPSKVLAIIVAYEHYDALNKCLDSVLHQDYPDVDIVVWDNTQPPDYTWHGVANTAEKVGASGVQIERKCVTVAAEKNYYWTPALNAAYKIAKHDAYDKHFVPYEYKYVLTLNHDVILPARCISNLVTAFEELPIHAGAVGPTGSGLGGLQGASVTRWDHRERVNYLIGACTMYKTEVFDKIGMFDINMPLSGDDFDYALRMREAGYSLWVDEKEHIHHTSHITGGSDNWNEVAKKSWEAFEDKYRNYFANEEEARRCLWEDARYNENYPVGTGLDERTKRARGIIV